MMCLFQFKETKMKSLATMQNSSVEFFGGENPPHALMEDTSCYSIVLNMFGIDQKDIGIKIDRVKCELAVLARKKTHSSKRGFFWVFGVPSETAMEQVTGRYKGGVLEIVIPKTESAAHGQNRAAVAQIAVKESDC
jgi:HSP20 family molecular chaperone IbpA